MPLQKNARKINQTIDQTTVNNLLSGANNGSASPAYGTYSASEMNQIIATENAKAAQYRAEQFNQEREERAKKRYTYQNQQQIKQANTRNYTLKLFNDWAGQVDRFVRSGGNDNETNTKLQEQGTFLNNYIDKYGKSLGEDNVKTLKNVLNNGSNILKSNYKTAPKATTYAEALADLNNRASLNKEITDKFKAGEDISNYPTSLTSRVKLANTERPETYNKDNYLNYLDRIEALAQADSWDTSQKTEAQQVKKAINEREGLEGNLILKLRNKEIDLPTYNRIVNAMNGIDMKLHPVAGALVTGFGRGSGAESLTELAMAELNAATRDSEGNGVVDRSNKKLADMGATDFMTAYRSMEDYTRQKAPTASSMGEIAGNIALMTALSPASEAAGQGISTALNSLGKAGSVIGSAVGSGLTFAGTSAIQNAGNVATGKITVGQYLKDAGISAAGGIAGGLASASISNGFANVLTKKGLETRFADFAKNMATSMGFATAQTGVSTGIHAATGDEVNVDEVGKSLMTAFAFSLINSTLNTIQSTEYGEAKLKQKYTQILEELAELDRQGELSYSEFPEDMEARVQRVQELLNSMEADLNATYYPGQQENINKLRDAIELGREAIDPYLEYVDANNTNTANNQLLAIAEYASVQPERAMTPSEGTGIVTPDLSQAVQNSTTAQTVGGINKPAGAVADNAESAVEAAETISNSVPDGTYSQLTELADGMYDPLMNETIAAQDAYLNNDVETNVEYVMTQLEEMGNAGQTNGAQTLMNIYDKGELWNTVPGETYMSVMKAYYNGGASGQDFASITAPDSNISEEAKALAYHAGELDAQNQTTESPQISATNTQATNTSAANRNANLSDSGRKLFDLPDRTNEDIIRDTQLVQALANEMKSYGNITGANIISRMYTPEAARTIPASVYRYVMTNFYEAGQTDMDYEDYAATNPRYAEYLTEPMKQAAYNAGEADQLRRIELASRGGENETGNQVYDGNEGRLSNLDTREQNERLPESTETRRGQGVRSVQAEEIRAAVQAERPVSTNGLGIVNGSKNDAVYVVPKKLYTDEMNSIVSSENRAGRNVRFIVGEMNVTTPDGASFKARGAIHGDNIIIRADHDKLSPSQIAKHEDYHAIAARDPQLNSKLINKIQKAYTPRGLQKLVERYLEAYGDALPVEELLEEILADAYADINIFDYDIDQDGATAYGEEVQKFVKENGYEDITEREPPEVQTKFSLDQPAEETDRLIALHNMSEDAVEGMLEIGGLAMPSVAITRADMGHTTYGDISVVYGKDSISPTNRQNAIYSGDAYTPTFPEIGIKVSNAAIKDIRQRLNELFEGESWYSSGYSFRGRGPNIALDEVNVADDIKRYGSFAEAYKNNELMKMAFLKENGMNIKMPYKAKEYANGYDSKLFTAIANKFDYNGYLDGLNTMNVNQILTKYGSEVNHILHDWAEGHYNQKLADKLYPLDDSKELAIRTIDNVFRETKEYFDDKKNGKTKQIDSQKLTKRINNALRTKKAQAEYETWLKDVGKNVIEKRGVRNDKDVFTSSGNRRSFEQLYWDYSLANIVRAMSKEAKQGKTGLFTGGGNIRGAAAKTFSSVEEARKDIGRLTKMDYEEGANPAIAAFDEHALDLCKKMVEGKRHNSFFGAMDAAEVLVEVIPKHRTADSIYRYLIREGYDGYYNITPEIAKEIENVIKEAQNLPTSYFEGKMYRAVPINEALAYVVPSNMDKGLKQRLQDAGGNVVTYKAGDNEDRLKKVNGVKGARFSMELPANVKPGSTEKEIADIIKTTHSGSIKEESDGQYTWADLAARGIHNILDSIDRTNVGRRGNALRSEETGPNGGAKTIALGIVNNFVKKGFVDFRGIKLDKDIKKAAIQLATHAQILRSPLFETSRVIWTKNNTVVAVEATTSYLIDSSYMSKHQREGTLAKFLGRVQPDGFYLMHNHPSGQVVPSNADLTSTKDWADGMRRNNNGTIESMFKGHVILDHNKFALLTLDSSGNIKTETINLSTDSQDFRQRTIDSPYLYNDVTDPLTVGDIGKNIVHGDNTSVLIYGDTAGKLVAIQEVDNRFIKTKDFLGYVKNRKFDYGARAAFLYTDDAGLYGSKTMRELGNSGVFMDIIHEFESYHSKSWIGKEPTNEAAYHVSETNRYSIKDSDYMAAVNNNDMETAQRMVDEAAEEAGYTVKAYHGTPWGGFTIFNTDRKRSGRTFGNGIYLTSSPTVAESFTTTNARDYERIASGEAVQPKVYDSYVKISDNVLEFDWDEFGRESMQTKVALVSIDIKANPGADVIIHNIKDGSEEPSTVYVIKDNNRIKSADPVTYDDNGNVIPLSERFNSENPDIRYSAETDLAAAQKGNAILQKENTRLAQKVNDQLKKNEALQKQNSELQEEVNRLATELANATSRPVNNKNFSKNVADTIKSYSSAADPEEITAELAKAADKFKSDPENAWANLKDASISAANKIINNAQVMAEYGDGYEVKKYLRGRPIPVSGTMKNDIPDYNKLRQAHFGTLNLSTKAPGNIEELYKELREQFDSSLFPESITNPTDMLLRLLDVVDDSQAIFENPYDQYRAEAVDYLSNELVSLVIEGRTPDISPKYTKKYEEMRTQNKEYAIKSLEEVVKERDRQIKALKKRYEKMAEAKKEKQIDRDKRMRLLKIAQRVKKMRDHTTRANQAWIDQTLGELDTIALSMTKKTVKNLSELKIWYDAQVNDPDNDFEPDKRITDKLLRLSQVQISGMNLDDVDELAEALIYIEHELRTKDQLIEERDNKEKYHEGSLSIRDINNAQGRKLLGLKVETLRPDTLMQTIVGYNPDSPLYKRFQAVDDGYVKKIDYQRRAYTKYFDRFLKNNKLVKDMRDREITISGHLNWETMEMVTAKISPDLLMSLYMATFNDSNMNHIMKGGIEVPNIDLYKKGKTTKAAEKSTKLYLNRKTIRTLTEKELTSEELAFCKSAQAYYKEMSAQEINDVSELLKGYPIAKVENYWRIHTSKAWRKTDLDVISYSGSIAGDGWTKEREQKSYAPVVLQGFSEQIRADIENHSDYVGLALPIRNFNKVYGITTHSYDSEGNVVDKYTDSVQHAIIQKFGQKTDDYIQKLMKDIQRPVRDVDETTKFLDKTRSNYAANALTLNLSVGIKQSASFPTAAAVIGWEPLIKALGTFPATKGKDADWISQYNPLMRVRAEGYTNADFGDIKNNANKISQFLAKPQLNLIQKIDIGTLRLLWLASEYYVRDNNPELKVGSEEYYQKVGEIHRQVTEQTQPNYTPLQRPQILRSNNDLTKILNMFKTQPYQNGNIWYEAIANFIAQSRAYKNAPNDETIKERYKEAKRKLGRAISSQLVASLVFSLMQFAWDWFRKKDSKYKNKEGEYTLGTWAKGIGINMLTNGFGMVPYAQTVFEWGTTLYDGVMKAMDKDVFFDSTFYGLELGAATDVINNFATALKTLFVSGAELIAGKLSAREGVQNLIDVATKASAFFGIPAGNVEKTAVALAKQIFPLIMGKYEGTYNALNITDYLDDNSKKEFYTNLQKALQNDPAQYQAIYEEMIQNDKFKTDSNSAEKNVNTAMRSYLKAEIVKAFTEDKEQYEALRKMILEHEELFSDASKGAEDYLKDWLKDLINKEDRKSEGIDDEKLAQFEAALIEYDADGNGSYKQEEIYNALESLNLSTQQKSLLWEQQYRKGDEKKKTFAEYSQIVAADQAKARDIADARRRAGLTQADIDTYEAALQKYDWNGNGSASREELYWALESLALSKNEKEYLWSEQFKSDYDKYKPTTDGSGKTEEKEEKKEEKKEESKNEGYVPVSSSVIAGLDYDYATGDLRVTLNSGATYTYNVSPETYEAFKNADSPGRFYNSYIK